MKFTIEHEEDGRWLAAGPELPGVLAYGATAEEAMAMAELLALRVIAEPLGYHRIIERKQEESHMAQPIILCDPDIQGGVPVFHGTRVPVKNLFAYLEAGDSLDQFPRSFPSVSRQQAVAVLELVREALVPDAHPA